MTHTDQPKSGYPGFSEPEPARRWTWSRWFYRDGQSQSTEEVLAALNETESLRAELRRSENAIGLQSRAYESLRDKVLGLELDNAVRKEANGVLRERVRVAEARVERLLPFAWVWAEEEVGWLCVFCREVAKSEPTEDDHAETCEVGGRGETDGATGE